MSNHATRSCPVCGAPYPVGAQLCERGHALPITYETSDEIRVEWIVPPTISRDGRLRLKVRVLDDSLTLYPDGASDGNGLDVNIVGPSIGAFRGHGVGEPS